MEKRSWTTFALAFAIALPALAGFTARADPALLCNPGEPAGPVLLGDGAGIGDAPGDPPADLPPGCWSGALANGEDVDAFLLHPDPGVVTLHRIVVYPPDTGCLRARLFFGGAPDGNVVLCAGDSVAFNGWIGAKHAVLVLSEGESAYRVAWL